MGYKITSINKWENSLYKSHQNLLQIYEKFTKPMDSTVTFGDW